MRNINDPEIHYRKKKNYRISVILVEPSKVQNLGSISRLMMNLGFSELIITNPQLNLADPEVEIVARRSISVINQAQLVNNLKDIRERFNFIIGTTARMGSDYNLKRVAISPEQLLTEKLELNELAVVFGREQYGLTNEEIALCDLLVSIPTHPSYTVLNISHAAAIVLYFLSRKIQGINQEKPEKRPKHRVATFSERQQLLNYFERLIMTTGYRSEKSHVAMQAFSNVLSRGYVTGRELTTLMGVLKWIELNVQEKT
ncbi:MAG: RNA methyltransferase [Candidatus Hodarchaeales archaeon]|jgi:TrmH family RNA methyltransferase